MVDRTDLDALLIGALYGELTPAEEARLTAHLESHPADRTALDNLTRTRAAVRDSRILAFQADPPQAISALLLQEAARRAPRSATVDRSETASWFQRFVRSFMAHPAMAAAATLVLVIGVAGTLYLQGTSQFAKSEPPVEAERAAAHAVTAPATAPVSAPEPEAPRADQAPGGSIGAGSSGGFATGADPSPAKPATPVTSDQTAAAQGVTTEHQAAAVASDKLDQREERDALSARDPYDKKAKGNATGNDAALRKLGAFEPPPARPTKAETVRGIELRTPQLMPKDLKESDDEKPASGRRESPGDVRVAGEIARNQRGAAATGGGAPAAPPASVSPVPAPARAAGPAGAADFDVAPAPAAPANEAKRPAAKPSVNRPPAPPAATSAPSAQNVKNAQNAQNDRRVDKTAIATNGDAANKQAQQAQSDGQSARDRTLLEWARKQHEQVIALVGANRCLDAASAAVEIYNRAPDYYNANIATDRQIRPCLAYVNNQRERAERSRGAKNAADVQAPAQAAPARK